jgi:hypothetical protein
MKRRDVIVGGGTTTLALLAGCTGGDSGTDTQGGDSGTDTQGEASGTDDSGDTMAGGVPVPPEYEKESTISNPREGVSIVRYTGSGTAAEALTKFKQSAEDSGWSERGTITVLGEWSGAGLEKGDELLVFHTDESDGEVTVTVVHGPKETLEPTGGTEAGETEAGTATEETPPDTDVSGSDVADVPRYPGSVRTDYGRTETDAGTEIVVVYLAEATFQEASEFYDDALPSNGWTIQKKVATDEAGGRVATKDTKKLELYWEHSDDYEGYVEIGVHVVAPSTAGFVS